MEPTSSDIVLTSAIGRAVAPGGDLEQVSRPLLELLQRVTGLDSVYFSVVHWREGKQEILFTYNGGSLEVPEGVVVDWKDTLCRRALLEGREATEDVEAAWGTEHAAGELGFRTYVTVPVITADRKIFGTLCAAGSVARCLRDADVEAVRLFARLIADQADHGRALTTARASAAAAEDRTRQRALLVAAAEHKVKTPLTVVAGIASTLDERWDDIAEGERRSLIARLARRCDDLTETVDAMLAEARADERAGQLDLAAMYLEPALRRAADDFGSLSDLHQLVVRCDPKLVCLAEPGALDQVLDHLVDNAIAYSPDGEILLSAQASGDGVVITVTDQGPGLPEGNLFEPFVRGANQEPSNGTGLGLHVVRSLVEAMDGSIEGATSSGGGAEFRITLLAC